MVNDVYTSRTWQRYSRTDQVPGSVRRRTAGSGTASAAALIRAGRVRIAATAWSRSTSAYTRRQPGQTWSSAASGGRRAVMPASRSSRRRPRSAALPSSPGSPAGSARQAAGGQQPGGVGGVTDDEVRSQPVHRHVAPLQRGRAVVGRPVGERLGSQRLGGGEHLGPAVGEDGQLLAVDVR